MRQQSKKAADSEAKVQEALKGTREGRFKNAAVAASSTGATRWISTPEILEMVEAAEAESASRKTKGKGKGKGLPPHISEGDLPALIEAEAYEDEKDIDFM